MKNYYFHKNEISILKKDLSTENIKNIIVELTDEDFNGNNGEDYFTTIEVDGELISMSHLDASWLDMTEGTTEEEIINNACSIIETIVSENYADGYYSGSIVRAIETIDSIVCIVAYMH